MFVLGTFEFYSAWSFFTSPEEKCGDGKMLPLIFETHFAARLIFSVYLLTLGLQRLSWYYGTQEGAHTFEQWGTLLLTHLVEASLWWLLANDQGLLGRDMFTVGLAEMPTFLYNIVSLQTPAQAEHLILLVGVPYLCLRIFTTYGPSTGTVAAKEDDKKK